VVTIPDPVSQTQHSRQTREAYDQLAAVWSATTDGGPFNGFLERHPSELADIVGVPNFIVYRLRLAG
jgi:hypothetical protein